MIQEQERAEKFFRAIQRDAERRRKEILGQIDSYIATERNKAEAQAQQTGEQRVQYECDRLQADTNRRLAHAAAAVSAQLATQRSAITEQVFGEASEKLKAFTQSRQYAAWLTEGARALAAALGEGAVLYARAEDRSVVAAALKDVNVSCTVQPDPAIRLGGLHGKNGAKMADDTLDSRLAAQRDWFLQNSGLSIAIQ